MNSLHHELFLLRTGIGSVPILPPESIATIEASPSPNPIEEVMRQLRAMLDAPPRRGTKAADLTNAERTALAVAAGAPYEVYFEGNHVGIRTKVPVGFADRGDGGYIVAIKQPTWRGDTAKVQLP